MQEINLNQLYDIMYNHLDPNGCGLVAPTGKLFGRQF